MKDTLGDYLVAIGRYPLLTNTEEIELSRLIQAMLPLRGKSSLTQGERKTLRIGEKAFRRFYTANLRLPVHIAKKYTRIASHMDLLDLIQEGTLGLNTAIERFDAARGYKFSTYAYWWIRQAITRGVNQKDRMIRLPAHTTEVLGKARDFVAEYRRTNSTSPPMEVVAKHVGTTADTLSIYFNMCSDAISLNLAIGFDEKTGTELIDMVRDESDHDFDDAADTAAAMESLDFMLAALSRDERDLIVNLYGLNGKPALTLCEYGSQNGVSRERIRQRRNMALNRMMLASRRWEVRSLSLSFGSGNVAPPVELISRGLHLKAASSSYVSARLAS